MQQAVRSTVVSLLGNLPPHVYDTSIASTGQNVASLMYSMQMTGYMFRNAEYRRSLSESLTADGDRVMTAELPPVSGTVSVEIAEGMKAEVDAAAYMAELRSEVEGLRAQLIVRRTAAWPHGRTTIPPHHRATAPIHHCTAVPRPTRRLRARRARRAPRRSRRARAWACSSTCRA